MRLRLRSLHLAAGGLATGLILAATLSAQAADLRVKQPVYKAAPPVAYYNWTGLYVGLHGGGAWARTTSENDPPFGGYDNGAPLSFDLSPSSFMGGGQIGYNWQTGSLVFGVEVDVGYLGPKESVTVNDDYTELKYGWYGTATGRLGYAIDNVLLYAKGGLAWARIKNISSDLDNVPLVIDPTDYSEVSKTDTGWAAGGGIEYGLTPAWTVKAEYLYMNFGTVSGTNLDGDFFTHDNVVHTAKLGFNYRF